MSSSDPGRYRSPEASPFCLAPGVAAVSALEQRAGGCQVPTSLKGRERLKLSAEAWQDCVSSKKRSLLCPFPFLSFANALLIPSKTVILQQGVSCMVAFTCGLAELFQ